MVRWNIGRVMAEEKTRIAKVGNLPTINILGATLGTPPSICQTLCSVDMASQNFSIQPLDFLFTGKAQVRVVSGYLVQDHRWLGAGGI